MKSCLLIVLLALSGSLFAQNEITDFPDIEAEFKDGRVALTKYIMNELIYPEKAIEENSTGRVIVEFVVKRSGRLSKIKVVSSPYKILSKEAKRIVKSMPDWTPASINGEAVLAKCSLPIVFTLE